MNQVTDDLYQLAERVGVALKRRKLLMAAAESCTGGWLAQSVTAVPGSSAWFECALVTYSKESKQGLLGVSADTLEQCGSVSEEVAREMARGCVLYSRAQVSVGISGVAGPDGGTAAKPVGTVCIAWAIGPDQLRSRTFHFSGDREAVRRQSVSAALEGIISILETSG